MARLIEIQLVKTRTVRFLSGVDAKESVKDIVVHRNKYCEDLTMLKGGVISSLMQLGVPLEDSAKYEMADKCRYYLSENIGTQAIIIDVAIEAEGRCPGMHIKS